ncbi:MAG TPA: hemolysin family protein [Gemmatimonadaceae bacterium]|nr:hemolysin family protein [Gemmatimonadaceae bacterium]
MSAGAVLAAVVAAGVAAAAAAADGALRAGERALARAAIPTAAVPGSARPVPVPDLLPQAEAAERRRRALSFVRLLGHLCVGFALGLLLRARGATLAATAAAVLLGFVVVLVAETAARTWGDGRGTPLLRVLSPVLRPLELLLAPVTALALSLDRRLIATLPSPRAEDLERETAAAQFRQVVAAEADVTRDEAALLQGVFSLADTEVHEIMVPRVEIVGIERDTPWSEVVDRVRSAEHSRFPVYEESIDEIVGVLHAKDLLPAILAEEEPAAGWRSVLRPGNFIPRTKRIADQLRDFRLSQSHIAFVVDEFGGTAGLVTIEDVLEEIVGEIRDEYDEEEPEIVVEEGRRFWVAGRVTLEELSERLDTDLEREGITTVGGLVYDELGRVPRPGESFTLPGFRVVVERVVRRKVQRVYFERLPEAAEPAGEEE